MKETASLVPSSDATDYITLFVKMATVSPWIFV